MKLYNRLWDVSTALILGLWALGIVEDLRFHGTHHGFMYYAECIWPLIILAGQPSSAKKKLFGDPSKLFWRIWRVIVLVCAWCGFAIVSFVEVYAITQGEWAAVVGGCIFLAILRDLIYPSGLQLQPAARAG